MKTLLKVFLVVVVIFILVSLSGVFYLTRGIKKYSDLEINGIQTSNLSNGTYYGEYKDGRWSNRLKILVKDQKITEIEVEKDVTFVVQGVSEELFQKVITTQNTTVDTISQATITSKAYLKSVENAFNQ
jgi:uncharacterized protein with FMN-binding domain